MSESKPVLDPASLLHTISQITPKKLESAYDALAATSHAIMLSVGCKFAGLGDDARQGMFSFSLSLLSIPVFLFQHMIPFSFCHSWFYIYNYYSYNIDLSSFPSSPPPKFFFVYYYLKEKKETQENKGIT